MREWRDFGSVGELAAAVAHEINQPLMAAGTYIRLVADTISSGNIDTGEVAETAKKAAAQVDRAAQVIRRLRALVRLDRSNRAPVRFEHIFKEIIELCKPDLDRARIAAHAHLAAGLPPVLVDVLQIEQVVLNLVRIPSRRSATAAAPAVRFGSKRGGPMTISSRSTFLIQDQASRASASKRDPCLCPLARPTDLVLGSRYVRRSWRRMEADFGWSHFRAAHPSTLRYRPQT